MTDTNEGLLPPFGARRLLYVGTGSIGVAHAPYWVTLLRLGYPELGLRVVMTRSAERFVSRGALAPMAGGEVLLDAWPDGPVQSALHVELAEWADAVIVQPATLHFLARFARGLADTPVLLALQCTTVPIVLAPALPPGAVESVAYRRHLAALAERPNVAVVPPVPGTSATTGRKDASAAAGLPDLLRAAEDLRMRLARGGRGGRTTDSPTARDHPPLPLRKAPS
ncbi:flavoprotein [Streptomyces sp. NPDC021056]|uniref:flavoprotein n=1 Tax=Streptomyces sp. NPDC021056 TaxID=3155012 RepID=UPI0033DD498A